MRTFKIEDMSCGNCQKKIEAELQREGIQASIDLEQKQLHVESSETDEKIIATVLKAGYHATQHENQNMDTTKHVDGAENSINPQYEIPNITCTNCALTISKQLAKKDVDVRINAGTKQMQVIKNPNHLNETEIIAEVEKAGYTAVSLQNNQQSAHAGHDHDEMFAQSGPLYKRGEFKLILSIVAFVIAESPMVFHTFLQLHSPLLEFMMNPWFQLVLATLTMWLVGGAFFKGAWNAFKNRVTTMDTLVTVGAFAAYGFSIMQMFVYRANPMEHYFFEATIAIIALIYLGHYLEEKATKRTNTALKELTELHAEVANHIVGDTIMKKKPSEIAVGDLVVVYRGEKIPLDGIITSGQGSVNEAMVSGEALPLLKEEGNHVVGGTLLESGELSVRVLKDEKSGTLSSIITAVEKAQFEKPEIQKTADKISEIFVPAILILALVTFGVYFFVLQRDFWTAISTALSVIVISCPCAFGLATPLSILIGSSLAAKRGILYKSGATFEQVRKIDAICFDKTGTLTYGAPKVVATLHDVQPHAALLYAAEKKSEHPLALAIIDYVESNVKNVEIIDVSIEEKSGSGILIQQEDGVFSIGSLKMAKARGVVLTKEQEAFIDSHAQTGASIVACVKERSLVNLLAIRDTVKKEAAQLIQTLQAKNIQVYMITGDMQIPAEAIGREVGVHPTHVFSEVQPVDKLEHIKKLQQQGLTVAFVGDGINDAPALAQANLGIAVGTGAKVALSAADITLVGGNISLIDDALQISKATLKNIFTNFGWAFSYNIVAIPIAMLGLLSPTLAAAFMAFSDIVVVLNAATLKLFRKK